MRLLLLPFLVLLFTQAFAQELMSIPTLSSPVIDDANFFSEEEANNLRAQLYSLYKNDNIQAQILTIDSLGQEAIEQFSIRVAEEWKLGNSEHDNGLLFILSRQERKTRIEVGSGLEGDITDLQSHKMIQELLVPQFKQGNFYLGFENAIKYSQALVNGDKKTARKLIKLKKKPHFSVFIPFVIFSFVSSLFSFSGRGEKKKKSKSLIRGLITSALITLPFLALSIISSVPILIAIAILGFIFGFFGFHQSGNYSSGGYGGGFRGGSGGGSSWGGGGGGFSGGGASGDW